GASSTTNAPNVIGRFTDQTQEVGTREAEILIQSLWKGFNPENTLLIRFDRIDEPEQYLDPAAQQTVQLHIHARNHSDAAAGKVNIVLDRII
ncbi:unnamed protein product, partial [marine sediment metagenome]